MYTGSYCLVGSGALNGTKLPTFPRNLPPPSSGIVINLLPKSSALRDMVSLHHYDNKSGHDRLLPHPFQFILTNHPTVRRCTVRGTDGVVKYIKNKKHSTALLDGTRTPV